MNTISDQEMQEAEALVGTLSVAQRILDAGINENDPHLLEGVRIVLERVEQDAVAVRNTLSRLKR